MSERIDEVLAKFEGKGRDSLIPMLQEVQEVDGFLSRASIGRIAAKLGLPPSKVYGVATFYNQFRFEPKGRFHIQVCRGTACHVKGSAYVLDAIERALKIKAGRTTRDGLFSIEVVACIGACGLAPVIAINGEFHAGVTTDDVPRILNEYRKRAEAADAAGEPIAAATTATPAPAGAEHVHCPGCAGAVEPLTVPGDLRACLERDRALAEEVAADHMRRLRRDVVERPVVFLGTGTCGLGAGAAKTLVATRAWLAEKNLEADVVEVGCIGLCAAEPMLDVQLPGRTRVSFGHVTADRAPGVLEAAFDGRPADGGEVIGQFRADGQAAFEGVPFMDEHPFFGPQKRWVLANCGRIDPGSIDEYVARGGYRAMSDTLSGLTPAEVCDLVEKSGLRGRGGGGFPTGTKWKLALQSEGDRKYLVCNADEGDPGAFMDRAVIEGDPHRLLEGMAIAAYGIGASKAYVYIRAEYPLAIRRLEAAIAQARAWRLLGHDILGSGFELDIVIKQGAGAFVCGEETALLHSIEGRRGMPRPRPPYPAQRGLFGKPTVINNVETLANLPTLLANGWEWFAGVGTDKSKGTKVFALSGRVERTGLVEVAMGTSIRDIVFAIGGGIPGGRKFKAVQIGGPSGGCIPDSHLDTLVDYESLKQVGAMMGSGGLVVMDETTCMVDLAKFFMDFIQRESCGKCIPCREGTRRMLETLTRVTKGRRSEKGVDALERFRGVLYMERLGGVIKDTSLCGLGQTASNPVLSTLRWFRDEYETHVFDRKCPAKACTEMLTYVIDPELCNGCTLCAKRCPSGAIHGAPRSPHFIVPEKCIACGTCLTDCRRHAISAS